MARPPRPLTPSLSARHYFGAELRRLRLEAELNQRELAEQVHYSSGLVAAVEKAQRWPQPDFTRALDDALQTGGALTRLLALVEAQRGEDQGSHEEDLVLAPDETVGRSFPTLQDSYPDNDAATTLDSPLTIARRTQLVMKSSVDDAVLVLLDQVIDDAIEQYERAGPSVIAPALAEQRRWVHQVMLENQRPRHRDGLFAIAAELSGVLAALALDLGRLPSARAYAVEAFYLAELVQRPDVQSWVRGTQSLVAYYSGHYREALEFARDGQRLRPGGPQTVRLLVNGEARALGRLGDEQGVRTAVGRAYELVTDQGPGVRISVSLDRLSYCEVRTAGNAATAFLSLGRAAEAMAFAKKALAVFDAEGLRGPQALTRLDMASALVQDVQEGSAEEVASLVHESLTVASATLFQPVMQRASELLSGLEPWQRTPAVIDLEELHRELTASVGLGEEN